MNLNQRIEAVAATLLLDDPLQLAEALASNGLTICTAAEREVLTAAANIPESRLRWALECEGEDDPDIECGLAFCRAEITRRKGGGT